MTFGQFLLESKNFKIVGSDSDLDETVFTVDINGKKVYVTITDYDDPSDLKNRKIADLTKIVRGSEDFKKFGKTYSQLVPKNLQRQF